MDTINIIKNNQLHKKIKISKILDQLSPSDIPYYISVEETSECYVIKLIYIHNKEEKKSISLGNASINIGVISGKIYSYECITSEKFPNIVSPLKFKDKLKESPNYKTDIRFRNNILSFINILNKVFLQDNNLCPSTK